MAGTQVSRRRQWVTAVEDVLGHVAAIIIGFILMVIGLGLGVTMVMLPVGLVVGLVGVALFISGWVSWGDQKA
jgi:hypothetical protein